MSLRDYAQVVARRKWIVIAAVVVAIALSLLLSALKTPVYESSAAVLVRARTSDTVFSNVNTAYNDAKRATDTEIKLIESEVVAKRVMKDLGLTEVPPKASGASDGNTDVVIVTVQHGDPTMAKQLADGYVQAYIEVRREQAVSGLVSAGSELQKKVTQIQDQIDALDKQVADAPTDQQQAIKDSLAAQRRVLVDQQSLFKQRLDQLQVDAALATGGAQSVREAELPTSPVEPTPVRSAVLAGIVGLLLGLGAAFLLDYLDDSIRTPDELARIGGGPSVLAAVPLVASPDHRPISLSKPDDLAVESYRGLRTGLLFLGLDDDIKVVQITSSVSGEGKTTTATNLASVVAQAGPRTELVDADLRRPRVHEVFGLTPTTGLTDALLGASVDSVVVHHVYNLDIIPSGKVPPNPSEMLGSRQMRELIAALAASYDAVIIDSAPVLPVTDSVALASSVQAVVLVAQSGRSSNKQVSDSIAQLRRVQAPLVGFVLNKLTGRRSRGGYGYGYGYGYAQRDTASTAPGTPAPGTAGGQRTDAA